ncbi:MAG: efflux RND transporter periplasmic adaptor subunit [Gammaproteobacteria bacterium]
MKPSPLRLTLVVAAALALSACEKSAPQAQGMPKRPPPEVSVVAAKAESVPVTRKLVGRLAPTRIAQVRARVAGIVLKREYKEGSDVKAGQVLFQIDPAPLKAALHARQAALAKARADAVNAAQTAKRYRRLHAKHLLSQQDLDTALANERTTAAAVQQAEADLETAKLNLGYATVAAPIDGRAGRALVTEGALVGQGEATELTTVEQIDPIYVNYSESVTTLAALQQQAGPAKTTASPASVQVLLPDGSTYPHTGTVDFSDQSVDPSTGAVSLRAVVPNPEHRLLPGMFVSLRVTVGHVDHGFLLPQAAVQRDQGGAYVMVVDAKDKVEQRRVETHGMTRTDWIVTGALHDGDRVIVEGLQKVHPGATAKAVPAGDTPGGSK